MEYDKKSKQSYTATWPEPNTIALVCVCVCIFSRLLILKPLLQRTLEARDLVERGRPRNALLERRHALGLLRARGLVVKRTARRRVVALGRRALAKDAPGRRTLAILYPRKVQDAERGRELPDRVQSVVLDLCDGILLGVD